MNIAWDENKNRENIRKHGVSFKEAGEIFNDPLHISVLDKRFDYYEERWITIGATKKGAFLVVGHLYSVTQVDEVIRIITARKATKRERELYEKSD
jgi:uncharacterized DUF497 family protein